ncbi:FG-GAP-like repeat-containing protein [Massilia endophytica]|uniref:FG-GAP-like repeat-containing protein n=1 Tax=Massilia endophytica TaxID=2899220 RepID=UPI001E448AB1|nr:Ig-like domain-containing protein [Massilia endophytica]UGQ46084.1 FG-GAP-like repeat-containing protein [Massilia endophytica]
MAPTVTSGTVPAGGTLTVGFTGTVKSALPYDTVYRLEIINASGTVLASQQFTTRTDINGNYINTQRTPTLTAALPVGTHQIRLRATLAEFDETTDTQPFTITVTSQAAPVNNASFVSQSVPSTMIAGQSYSVSVTMQNTGTTTWSPGGSQPHGLGSQNPQDNAIWRANRVALSSTVAPGASRTFSFTVTAPSTAGTYNFQWRMVQDFVEWFGGYSTNVPVVVTYPQPTATFSSPSEGATYTASNGAATVSFSGSGAPGTGASVSSLRLLEGGVAFGTTTSTSISASKSLAIGSHTIELQMTDSRGQTKSVYRTVNVVAPKPTVSMSSPASDRTVTASGTTASQLVSGSATAVGGSAITKIELLDNGAVVDTKTSTTSYSSTRALAIGSHSLALRATNALNEYATTPAVTVTVTPPPPVATITAPGNGSTHNVVSGNTVGVTISASGSSTSGYAVSSIQFYVDGAASGAAVAGASASKTVQLTPGSHTLGAAAIDSIGTVGSQASVTVNVVDQTLPSVTLVEPASNVGLVTASTANVSVGGTAFPASGTTLSSIELLQNGVVVATSTSTTISRVLSLAPGSYTVQLRATSTAGKQGYSATRTINVSQAVAGKSAQFVSQTVPSTMRAGQPYRVTVRMLNNGTTTWTDADMFRLGSQNPQDNRTWAGRVYLPTSVATGESADFTFDVTAPFQPGTYDFQWQMLREGDSWFGEKSANVPITVSTGAGPTAVTLSASPSNVRVTGTDTAQITLKASASSTAGMAKLELFKDSGHGYGLTPANSKSGNGSPLTWSTFQFLPAGLYNFKLRATDVNGVATDSPPVTVSITNSDLQGAVSGIRSNASGNPELFGYVCQVQNPAGLPFKVMLDAPTPDAGGTLLTQGVANVSTERDDAAVRSACITPSNSHHFVVDLAPYIGQYAGRALYVWAELPDHSQTVTLPCADNSCTMPGAMRVAMTTPQNGDQVASPNPVFMRMQITNGSGSYDEVAFNVDGQWVTAAAEGTPGMYSASKSGLAVRTAPYAVYAKVRAGNTTITSLVREFTVVTGLSLNPVLTSPANGATLTSGAPQQLTATVEGTVQSVKFFANGTLLGSATLSGGSWQYSWTPAAEGSYSLQARSYDGAGTEVGASATNTVTVAANNNATPVPIIVDVPQLGNGIGGTLPGQVVANSDGSSGYSLPLQLPPGILGMVPSLSLNYDGNSTSGLAGLGWSIAGISRIERCGKVIATDGKGDGVRFLDGAAQPVDRLCLDGQRLILANGSSSNDAAYWASGAVYRTEVESFTRVTALGADGKLGFKVETKDGRTSYYGDTANSHVDAAGRSDGLARRWYISRSNDRSGNTVAYDYNEDAATGESTPKSISWGANPVHGTPHFAQVLFHYELRTDRRVSYLAGSRTDERNLLTSIQTRVDTSNSSQGAWVTALTYNLSHALSASSGRSLLKSVEACDASGCLPATSFSWGERDPNAPRSFVALGSPRTGPDLQQLSAGSNNRRFDTIVAADFNGDGLTDLMERYRDGTTSQQRLYESAANGSWTAKSPLSLAGNIRAVLEAADFDGDGLPDLLVTDSGGTLKLCRASQRTGDQYNCAPVPLTASSTGTAVDPGNALAVDAKLRLVRDFNADGRDDLYLRTQAPGQVYRAWECLSTGAAFSCTEVTGSSNQKSLGFEGGDVEPFGPSGFADIDGDGRVDRMIVPKCEWKQMGDGSAPDWYCGNDDLGPQDLGVIGTGEPEVGAVRVHGYWLTYPNNQTAIAPQLPQGTMVGDLNADGYSDLVLGSVTLNIDGSISSGQGWLCLSKGDGNGDCRMLPVGGVPETARHYLSLTVGDFDGDGVVDVLRPISDSWETSNIQGDKYQLCRIGANTAGNPADLPLYQSCEAWTGPQFYAPSQRLIYSGASGAMVERSAFLGDFNGDGKTDIATHLGNGQWVIHGAANQALPGQALDKLITVTNGLGGTDTIEYALPNDSAVYRSTVARDDGQNLVGKLTYPSRPLVKSVRRTAGMAGERVTTYSYARLAADANGRGSLGFAEIVRTDMERGIATTSWPCLTFPHIGAECASRQKLGGVVLRSVTNEWQSNAIALAGGGQTRLPYLYRSTVVQRDPGNNDLGTSITVTAAPDSWGNVTNMSVTSKSDSNTAGWTADTVMTYYPANETDWRIGELKDRTETRTNNYNQISRLTSYSYDSLGRLNQEVRDGDVSEKLTTTYDRSTASFGLVGKTILSWTDPNGGAPQERTTTVNYTANGRFPASVTNAQGHTEQRQHDARTGLPTSVTDANGLITTSTTDAFGRVLTVTAPDGTVTETSVKKCNSNCPAGAGMVSIRDTKQAGDVRAAVPVLVFADRAGQAVRTFTWGYDGRTIVTDSSYDTAGRLSKVYWPRFNDGAGALVDNPSGAVLRSQTTYDALDRPLQVKTLDELGAEQTTTHTWEGFKHKIRNPKNFEVSETRDVWGKLAQTADADLKVTAFLFDAFGNLAKTTDSKGNVVTVSYDRWGRRTKLTDPDLGTTNYSVDAVGQTWKQVSPNELAAGQATLMQYDKLGRMTSRVSGDMTASWTYDALAGQGSCSSYRSCGKLVESRTLAGSTSVDFWQRHTYDSKGRPDTTTTSLDTNYTSKHVYDIWGRLLREEHQRGTDAAKAYERRYNAWGQLARIERAGQAVWTGTGQDAAGRMTGWTLGNGLAVSQQFNANTGRLGTGAVGNVLTEDYHYDVLGNVSQRSQRWGTVGFAEDFQYDSLNRLKNSQITNLGTMQQQPLQVFTYDELGNMLSKTGVGTGNYEYPLPGAGRPHAVSNIPGVGSFNYDFNGNMTSGAGRTVTWNSFDMPVQISKGGASSTFYYGADHQRVKQVRSDGVTLWYAGAMEVEAGTSTTVKTYLPNGIGVEIEKSGTSTLLYTHQDRLGSVVAITDGTGAVVESLAYDSWGKRRDRVSVATPDSLDGDKDNKGFTGHEMLDQLDLVHMNGRVYDPLVARFMSADPIIQDPLHSQSYNRYSYVWNNPTNLTDPTGFVGETAQGNNQSIVCRLLGWCGPSAASKGARTENGESTKENGSAVVTKDSGKAQEKSAGTNRNDLIREAMLSSPNRLVTQSAACVGNEAACVMAGAAPLGGGWLIGTKLGQATLALLGFGAEVQGVADGTPSGRGTAGLGAKAAASSAEANVAALANGESILVNMNPKNLISQQSKNEMSGSVIKRLEKDMRANGYDASQPVSAVVRADGRVVISDGHHRVQAAIRAGITGIPVDVYRP